jgi:hypothetical protein
MSMTLDSAGSLLAGLSSISQPSANAPGAASKSEAKAASNPAFTVSLSSAALQGTKSTGAVDTLYNARGATTNLSGAEIPQFQASIDADVSAIEMMLSGDYGQQLDDLINK